MNDGRRPSPLDTGKHNRPPPRRNHTIRRPTLSLPRASQLFTLNTPGPNFWNHQQRLGVRSQHLIATHKSHRSDDVPWLRFRVPHVRRAYIRRDCLTSISVLSRDILFYFRYRHHILGSALPDTYSEPLIDACCLASQQGAGSLYRWFCIAMYTHILSAVVSSTSKRPEEQFEDSFLSEITPGKIPEAYWEGQKTWNVGGRTQVNQGQGTS